MRDGDGPQKSLLGKFCGEVVPSPVKSSENSMYIKFYSDGLIPKRGFVLKWHTIHRPTPPPGPPDGNNNKGTATVLEGSIMISLLSCTC